MALKVLSALETSKITVPTPSATTDAATKQYVDSNSGGDGGGSVDLSSIVPAFSSTKTYPRNSFVSYNGKIYKCSTPVSTAGEFTGSANWTESPLVVSSESSNAVSSTRLDDHLFSIPGIHVSKYQRIIVNSFDPVYSSYPTTLYNEVNGCYIFIPSSRSPAYLEFEPTLRGTDTLPENSYTYTPEIIISCDGSNGKKGQKFNFEIVDSYEDSYTYLDSDPITELERGYTYFIVARQYFTYNSSGSIVQKWVLNVQGKVENPT